MFTLPSRQCDTPETAEVPISAMWTDAEASAGARPRREQQAGRRHAVAHAQRAVDELGDEAGEGDGDQGRHGRSSSLGWRLQFN